MQNRPRTEAQISANRQNAQKSTGPCTPAGKAASSRNATIHGLASDACLLPNETSEEFLELLRDHYDRFQPTGAAEEELVMRLAANQWRLRRVFGMEAGLYRTGVRKASQDVADQQQDYLRKKASAECMRQAPPAPPTLPDPRDLLAGAFEADSASSITLLKLARYEAGIERSIDRILRQLKTFQAARLSQPVEAEPTPAEPADTDADPTSNYGTNPRTVEFPNASPDLPHFSTPPGTPTPPLQDAI